MVHFSPNILTRKIYVLFLLQSGSTGIPFVITPENSVKAGDFLRCQQQSSWWWMRARSWDQIGWHMEVGEGGKSVRTGKCKGASPAGSALPRACPHSAHISWLQPLAAAATHIFWGFVLQGRNKIQLVLAKCKHFHPDGNNLKCWVWETVKAKGEDSRAVQRTGSRAAQGLISEMLIFLGRRQCNNYSNTFQGNRNNLCEIKNK